MLAAGAVVADYRIEGFLGRGGMGVVYRARHTAFERPIALKLIAPEFAADPSFRHRFERELQIATSLDHPNIVPVYDAGEDEGVLFIAMRFVEGHDLGTMLATEGPPPAPAAADIVAQVARALDSAHEQGYVHRDVKPRNVLLDRRGRRPHAYLTDFGVTKRALPEATLTGSGQWVGTLDYVSPEEIRGEPVTAGSDVYSLGCLLFAVLAGRPPFVGESDFARLWAHISEEPPSVAELVPGIPDGLRRGSCAARSLRTQTIGGPRLASSARQPWPPPPGARPPSRSPGGRTEKVPVDPEVPPTERPRRRGFRASRRRIGSGRRRAARCPRGPGSGLRSPACCEARARSSASRGGLSANRSRPETTHRL